MEKTIAAMTHRIAHILKPSGPTLYLHGSVVMDDFRPGWSDIDILCLCREPITEAQAGALVNLRQTLLEEHPGNPYFRLFEGGFLTWENLIENTGGPVVYWGTSGQRITDAYAFDAFSRISLVRYAKVLRGQDDRHRIPLPAREDILGAAARCLGMVREHAKETPRRVTSAEWLLMIARCLYTLETNDIIAKTEAGRWALSARLAPDPGMMRAAIDIREQPLAAKADEGLLDLCAGFGPHIQAFADVLEQKLLSR